MKKKIYCPYCKEMIEIDDTKSSECYGDEDSGITCECCGRVIYESK